MSMIFLYLFRFNEAEQNEELEYKVQQKLE